MASIDTADWSDAPTVGGFQLATAFGTGTGGIIADTGVFYCGSSPLMVLQLYQTGGVTAKFQLQFYFDDAGTRTFRTPLTWLSATVDSVKYLVVAAQAPYARVTFNNLSVSSTTASINVTTSPGVISPAAVLGGGVTVAEVNGVSVAANTVTPIVPTFLLPGKATLWANLPAASTYTGVQRWDGSQWVYINQIGFGQSFVPYPVTLPSDDYRVVLQNSTAGALTFYMALIVD